jgi:hypothetical protein
VAAGGHRLDRAGGFSLTEMVFTAQPGQPVQDSFQIEIDLP